MANAVRVRFAPSPTGPLHIGGVRTALYNYLFAKKNNGTFILRIEDTDQKRYVEGAESYILNALKWFGIEPDEGPVTKGDYGPYRQSERQQSYAEFAQKLIDNGTAYFAFDSPEELTAVRNEFEAEKKSFKYGVQTRMQMKNSLTLSGEETQELIKRGNYTVRMKIPSDEVIHIDDIIRGSVKVHSNELDDKVILKGDGLPTYHLANVVDDFNMKISHVIRGEEWLPSTGHHILLYRFLGIEDQMPEFAHLPLILKPTGKGKLSKRDGSKLGIPVFPLKWDSVIPEDSFLGFKEFGFQPEAVLNFLALLGWNPGTEQEMFSLQQLENQFNLDKIGKSGARFDYEKAKWFNQQYILGADSDDLAEVLLPDAISKGYEVDEEYLSKAINMMKERVVFAKDILEQGDYLFVPPSSFDEKMIRKKWKVENKPYFLSLMGAYLNLDNWKANVIKESTVALMNKNELGFGAVLPILRLALSGTMKGPDVFEMMELIGVDAVKSRFYSFLECYGK